jgi:hypothetical protein
MISLSCQKYRVCPSFSFMFHGIGLINSASILVMIWSARLAGFLLFRVLKTGSDTRFDEMRSHFFRFAGFWAGQILWVWVVCMSPLSVLSFETELMRSSTYRHLKFPCCVRPFQRRKQPFIRYRKGYCWNCAFRNWSFLGSSLGYPKSQSYERLGEMMLMSSINSNRQNHPKVNLAPRDYGTSPDILPTLERSSYTGVSGFYVVCREPLSMYIANISFSLDQRIHQQWSTQSAVLCHLCSYPHHGSVRPPPFLPKHD